jgi:RNA polymerase sigma-70 factor (ECF subfamily)
VLGVRTDAIPQPEAHDEWAEVVATLFEVYATAICAYLHSLVGDWHLAHDLTQETYLQLHRTRRRLQHVENRRAWVYSIASHIAFNEVKRRRRFRWLPWSATDDHLHFIWTSMAEEVAQRAMVERALAQLPVDYRAPLLLYSGYDFSVREVAEAMGISEGAAKVRLHRARQMFRKVYEGDEA